MNRTFACCAVALLLTGVGRAAEPAFAEGASGKAVLKYVNGLPVLTVEGTPKEVGTQVGALGKQALGPLSEYVKKLVGGSGGPGLSLATRAARGLGERLPADRREELAAIAEASGAELDVLMVGNVLGDLKKLGGCSTIIAEPGRSATGQAMFGRNLDFPTLGILDKYTLVVVYKQPGKRSFASVGFPGMVGCLSGMNDAGLSMTINEVGKPKDGTPLFDPEGVPIAIAVRRVMEECATVGEAKKLLGGMKLATTVLLTACDAKGGCVFECSTTKVIARPAEEGVCLCTNHFRVDEFATNRACDRYPKLEPLRKQDKIAVADVARYLDFVNQGKHTLQTMVFEPEARRLHLAIGETPSTKVPLRSLELKRLFE